MPAPTGVSEASPYFVQLSGVVRHSFAALLRLPSSSLRAEAASRTWRHAIMLLALGAVAIAGLMVFVDAWEIGQMPPRGTASLWPARVLTDFGKDSYVIDALGLALLIVALIFPLSRENFRMRLLGLGTRIGYLLLALIVPLLVGEIIKWVVGRGRPFVGGKAAGVLNFVPFDGTEAHFSFPSAHSITAFALAFAVSALWPRARVLIFFYAVVILGTRLVLLAHHPSDVVAGTLIGVVGAMAVRYWFAARELGFDILDNGEIVPLSRH
jgi:membrane-associated phospholipid phosphatase